MNGEIEILAGWDDEHRFAVSIRNPARCETHIVEAFATREEALLFARGMIASSDLVMRNAKILPLKGGAA